MKELSWEDIYKDLRNKIYYPVYMLMGEEPFYIDVISDYIEEHVLGAAEKDFNQSILYGRETDIPAIVSTAKRFPMMSDYQVVIVKEAHNIRDIENLEPYVRNPLKSTILVICYKYKTLDKRKSFYKSFEKNGVVLDSKKVYENKMAEWISTYVKRHGYKIGSPAAQLLADHLGNDLGKVVNEIKKVYISLPKGGEFTPALIEQNIGISKDFNVFELQDALATRNSLKAFQIAQYFAENSKNNPFPVTLAILNGFFTRLLIYHSLKDKSQGNVASEVGVPPYRVAEVQKAAASYSAGKLMQIFGYMREYDTRFKGLENVSASEGDLLKELIFKILN